MPSWLTTKNFSSSANSETEKRRFYYGWIVLAASLVIGIIGFGTRLSFGVFFKSLEQDFGWTRAVTSGVLSLHLLLGSAFAILAGWAIDRYGSKRVFTLMGVFIGLSLFLTSRANTLWHLFVSYSLLSAIGIGPMYPLIMATVSRWFARRRGLIIGIASSGSGIGPVLMAPIAAYLISSYGWRTSYFIMALMALFIIIPCAQLLKRAPSEVAALPEDERLKAVNLSSPQGRNYNEPEGFSLAQAAKTRNFWLFFFVWFLTSFCIWIVVAHIVRHAEDLGITSMRAASILSLIGGMSILGRLTMGRVSDSIGRKQASIICALLMVGAMLWLIEASNLWMLYLFAVVFGFSYGGESTPITAFMSDVFGLRHIGVIMGVIEVSWAVGAAFGPALAGYVFDVRGNYDVAFLAGMIAMLIAAVFILLLKAPVAAVRDRIV